MESMHAFAYPFKPCSVAADRICVLILRPTALANPSWQNMRLLGAVAHLLEALPVLVLVHLGLPLPPHAVCMHGSILLQLFRHAEWAVRRHTLPSVPTSKVTTAAAGV